MSESLCLGWIPDHPDIRDYTPKDQRIRGIFKKIKGSKMQRTPGSADLRPWCSPVEDQLNLGSCTANAGAGMYEYFERRSAGNHINCSRLFLYKVTRNLLGWSGDTGAYLRTTMAALALFGTPPEKYYPYTVANFDVEPSAFCYAFAQSYQAIQYFRLDPPGTNPSTFLNTIKNYLAAGYVSIVGFTVYNSISQAGSSGKIPFPVLSDKVAGGHAIMLVGYNDAMKIKNSDPGAKETTGALLLRNSWGSGWGEGGYGWLPYEYVLQGLARDCWSMIKGEWVNTGQFGLPS